jgi:hypothetical protein
MMKCKYCNDEIFYLNDAIDESDNGWKHVIDFERGYIRTLGNKGCDNPEPSENFTKHNSTLKNHQNRRGNDEN